MKKVIAYIGIIATTALFGCKKEGCTDANADNYEKSASKSDNSCTYRYPTAVVVNNIPATNTNGTPWDDGSPADVYVRFSKSTANDWLFTTETEADATTPVTFTINNAATYFTNEDWKYEVRDFDLLTGDETIAQGVFNPLSSGQNGSINITNGNTSLTFQYAARK